VGDTGAVIPALTTPATNGAPTADRGAQADGAGQATILTGEAVHLQVRIAGVGSRVLARMFDLLLQVFLFYVLLVVAVLVGGVLGASGVVNFDEALVAVFYFVVLLVAFVGYTVFLETLTRGRTLGKYVFGLRVVRDDGGPITFRQSLTRTLVAFAVEWPGVLLAPITWLVTIWAMIASRQSKRLGDHVAGTIVIHERTPAAWGWTPAMPPGLAMWAATLDLTGLDNDLAGAVRAFLARNRRIREPARSQLGERLVREVAAVTNPPPPPGTPAWMYLAAVHAERHRRAMARLAEVRSRASTVWPDLHAAVAPPPVSPRPVRRATGTPPSGPQPLPSAPPIHLRPPTPT
jgi:uncharacterized RDD family membrane protein YckC